MSSYADDALGADVCSCDAEGCTAQGVMEYNSECRLTPPKGWVMFVRHTALSPTLSGNIHVCPDCVPLLQDGFRLIQSKR